MLTNHIPGLSLDLFTHLVLKLVPKIRVFCPDDNMTMMMRSLPFSLFGFVC